MLASDKALDYPEEDKLGYKSFAENMAKTIMHMTPTDGIVMSIYGPWGSGKSTIINFITYYLKTSEDEKPEIMFFNPWWFTGSEDIARIFFEQFTASLDPKNKSLKKIRETLGDIGEVVEKIPKIAIFGRLAKLARPKKPSLHELKKKLEDLLKQCNERFVIVIDDVDRLTPDEIKQLFSVIKAIANLPNIVYLVGFDNNVVADSLSQAHGINGAAYLDKIVQMPFDLPKPDKPTLRRWLTEKIDAALGDAEDTDFDEQYWGNVFFDGIDPLVSTPRDVTRLSNALTATHPVVRGEVNTVDFIAIEALRVFVPKVYHIIQANSEEFTGIRSENESEEYRQRAQSFHDEYISNLEQNLREPIRMLLQRIFPKLRNVGHAYAFLNEWRRQKRICSPDIFPVYFRLELPTGAVSAQELNAFIALADNQSKVEEKLLSLVQQRHPSGITKARALLERLEDYTRKNIDEPKIIPILKALFNTAYQLEEAEPERRGSFDFGVDSQVGRIIYQLIMRLEKNKRYQLMTEVIDKGSSLHTIVREVSFIESFRTERDGRKPAPEEEQILSIEQLQSIIKKTSARIKDEAREGRLIEYSELFSILFNWRKWDEEECIKWVEGARTSEKFIVSFLTSLLQEQFSHGLGGFGGMGDRVEKKEYSIQLDAVKLFIPPESIKGEVRKIIEKQDLKERQKLALEVFLQEIESPQKE